MRDYYYIDLYGAMPEIIDRIERAVRIMVGKDSTQPVYYSEHGTALGSIAFASKGSLTWACSRIDYDQTDIGAVIHWRTLIDESNGDEILF